MATLKFGKATALVGFSSLKTARFNDLPAARIVRELVQNSLDAAKEAKVNPAIVRFHARPAKKSDIPDIQGLSKALKSATAYHKKANSGKLPEPAQEAVNRINAGLNDIKKGKAFLLSVTDNGIGLDAKSMQSLLGDGASTKRDPSTGAYGVGHLAPLALSDIRYMMYGGLTKGNNRIACGWSILASHPGKTTLNDAEGYLVKDFKSGLQGDLYDFLPKNQRPKAIERDLDQIAKEWGHGTTILIPAFNNFRSKAISLWEIVSKVVSYNFCPAIYREALIVEVIEGQETHQLNKGSLEDILGPEGDRVRAARSDSFFRELRPSGTNAFSILKTLQSENTKSIPVNGDTAHVSVLTPLEDGQSRVELFRNGMWISDDIPGLRRTEFAGLQPFHATIEINKEDGGELHRLVLKAEGPLHDRFSFVRLSSEEEESLKVSINTISEWIKSQVPEIGAEEYTIDDYLVVRTDGHRTGGKEKFSFWGLPTPMARRRNSQIIDEPVFVDVPPIDPEPPTPPVPRPPRPPEAPERAKGPPITFPLCSGARGIEKPEGFGTMRK